MSAYSDALKMLARRELSEAQVRQRLARRQHDAAAIDSAIERLREQRAIDDVRAAESIARIQITAKRRGERRAQQQIARAGIAPSIARRVAREAAESVDADAQIAASIDRRLRGRTEIADDREFRRLFRYLIGQGFEPDRIRRALDTRSGRRGRRND